MCRKLMILGAVFFVQSLGCGSVWAWDWDVQIVDGEESGSETGTFSNIVVDSLDRPRISYYDGGDNCLRFAAWNGTSWQRETVDPGGPDDEYAQGRFNCMVIDSQDRCHISYRDRRYFRLKYVVQDGAGGWEPVQVVDNPGPIPDPDGKGRVGVGRFTSIDLDSNEYPHISYTDLDNGYVKYAKRNGLSWDIEVVYDAGAYQAIQGTCIQIDSHDWPHIAFVDTNSTERFKCARWNGSNWDIQTIDPSNGSDHPTIMAIDSNDNLHVICGNRYFRSNGSVWTKEVIPGLVGGGTSIELDRYEYPHIAITQNNNMWYAYYDGTTWLSQPVDTSPEAGEERCLALDSRGFPHLSYWAQKFYDENQLRYATVVGPECWHYGTQCHGDCDNTHSVKGSDFLALKDSWYKCYPKPGYDPCADFDRDGCVNDSDLLILRNNWYQRVRSDCPRDSAWLGP